MTALGSRLVASLEASHLPWLVMAIGTISYLPRSRALMTDSAERSETSCSPERPPKITPTLSFFDKDCSSENVAQPAEVALLPNSPITEAAQPRQVALLSPPIFILSGRRYAT